MSNLSLVRHYYIKRKLFVPKRLSLTMETTNTTLCRSYHYNIHPAASVWADYMYSPFVQPSSERWPTYWASVCVEVYEAVVLLITALKSTLSADSYYCLHSHECGRFLRLCNFHCLFWAFSFFAEWGTREGNGCIVLSRCSRTCVVECVGNGHFTTWEHSGRDGWLWPGVLNVN